MGRGRGGFTVLVLSDSLYRSSCHKRFFWKKCQKHPKAILKMVLNHAFQWYLVVSTHCRRFPMFSSWFHSSISFLIRCFPSNIFQIQVSPVGFLTLTGLTMSHHKWYIFVPMPKSCISRLDQKRQTQSHLTVPNWPTQASKPPNHLTGHPTNPAKQTERWKKNTPQPRQHAATKPY